MVDDPDVVIVGAGHGGAQAAIALRQQGYDGSMIMIGRDPEPPYERPPLSKEYLAREKEFERIYIRPPQFWAERSIDLMLGRCVTGVDPTARAVVIDDASCIRYKKLIWATGGDPRRLPCLGEDLSGVHTVRYRADVDRIIEELDRGAKRVVVVGGGYIGLEAAAVLTKLGCEVTVLEALPRILARVAGEAVSEFYQDEHVAHGVDLRLEASVNCIEGENGWVRRVRLADGTEIACDMVVVGIGIAPAVGPLIAAGATGANGVDVDEFCRTSLDDIYAIGDCAAHANPYAGGAVVRLESVQNANDMATTVAKHICGTAEPYHALPWFWSNQYDLKLQTAGLSLRYDEAIVRGAPGERKFSVIYLRQGRVIAMDCVNNVKDYVQGRKLVETGIKVDPAHLSNQDIGLKDLMSLS